MNGEGFKCDQCGKAVIVPVPPGYRQSPPNAPLEWFVLLGPVKTIDGSVTIPQLHLCSVQCVAGWSHNTLAAAAAKEET